MADIFRKTNADRETAAGLNPQSAQAAQPPGPDPATGISFTGKTVPVDPAKAAAQQAAKIRLLRGG